MDDTMRTLICRLEAAIDRLSIPGSIYAGLGGRARHRYVTHESRLRGLVTLATAMRDDIAAGWVVSVVEMAHADAYAGYLEIAEGRSGEGCKDAAAVIAGTSLEVQLKALATKHGVSLQTPSSAPEKIDAVNAELKAAGDIQRPRA